MSYGRIERKPVPKVGFRDNMVAITPPTPEKVEGDYFPKVKPTLLDRSYVVLKKVVIHPIFGLVIPFLPKTVQNMFYWIRERLQEPSTYHGLNAFVSAVGFTLNPEAFEFIAQVALAVFGLIEIIRSGGKFVDRTNAGIPEEPKD